jgi:hypothetical protein
LYSYQINWGETTNLNLEKLCKLQKRAARIILNAKYDIPSLQLLYVRKRHINPSLGEIFETILLIC